MQIWIFTIISFTTNRIVAVPIILAFFIPTAFSSLKLQELIRNMSNSQAENQDSETKNVLESLSKRLSLLQLKYEDVNQEEVLRQMTPIELYEYLDEIEADLLLLTQKLDLIRESYEINYPLSKPTEPDSSK